MQKVKKNYIVRMYRINLVVFTDKYIHYLHLFEIIKYSRSRRKLQIDKHTCSSLSISTEVDLIPVINRPNKLVHVQS